MFIVVLRSLGFEVICFAGIYNIQYVVLVFFFFFSHWENHDSWKLAYLEEEDEE